MVKLAFVFPGQGAHRPGMARAWSGHPAAATFNEVGAIAGLDLLRLADDPAACAATAIAQPAVYATSIAAWRAVTDLGIDADVVAGHSLGEVSAAVAAGVLSVADGARVVTERGRAFAEACAAAEPGGMIALLGADLDVAEIVADSAAGLVIANDNAPGQVVLSGPVQSLTTAQAVARNVGVRVTRLSVEGAFHSPAIASALPRLAGALAMADTRDPKIPLVRGVDASEASTADEVLDGLTTGALATVRWTAVQQRLRDLGVTTFIELGPGAVLRGLAKRTVSDVTVHTVHDPESATTAADAVALVPTY